MKELLRVVIFAILIALISLGAKSILEYLQLPTSRSVELVINVLAALVAYFGFYRPTQS